MRVKQQPPPQPSIKLLITILTSNHLDYLSRAVESVQSQYACGLEYEIKIVVNSLETNYYHRVLAKFPQLDVIETVSNGAPGKGHNACLNVFYHNPQYDYLSILDGDDVLYPTAFQRFSCYIDNFDFDVLHLMVNDTVKVFDKYEEEHMKLLRGNFYLLSTLDDFGNHWQTSAITIQNPFNVSSLLEVETPSRIVLANRRILNANIRYDEQVPVHDDLIAFCCLYEAQSTHQLKTLATSDTYIYVYNRLNDDSVSRMAVSSDQVLNQKFEAFERQFASAMAQFKHIQNWKLKELPFGVLDPPTNYSTQNKIDFINIFYSTLRYEKKSKINDY